MISMERIRLQCVTCGDCWLWHGYYERNQPRSGGRSVRSIVYEHKHGPYSHDPKMVVTVSCENMKCVNPAHVVRVAKTVVGQRTGRRGLLSTVLHSRKKAEARRKQSGTITMEIARAVRISPLKAKDAAVEFNISRSLVYKIRQNKTWKEYDPSPFLGLFTALAANDSKRRAA